LVGLLYAAEKGRVAHAEGKRLLRTLHCWHKNARLVLLLVLLACIGTMAPGSAAGAAAASCCLPRCCTG
jgi:hypothetical protein